MLARTAHIVLTAALAALVVGLVTRQPSVQHQSAASIQATNTASNGSADDIDALGELTMLLGDATLASAPPLPHSGAERRSQGGDSKNSGAKPSAATQSAPARQARNQQELVQRWLEVANDIDPELGARLTALSQKSPAAFDRQMRHGNIGRNLNSMSMLKQRDPDLYQTKVSLMMQTVQVNRIAAQLRKAKQLKSEAQVETLSESLKSALEHQLGLEIKDKGDYICRIEEQLERAREELIREAINFPHTIDVRMAAHMKERASESAEIDDLTPPDSNAADDDAELDEP